MNGEELEENRKVFNKNEGTQVKDDGKKQEEIEVANDLKEV